MNRDEATVTVVSVREPGKKEANTGDKVYFEKDLNNKDPFAIRVFLSSNKKAVGFVANSDNTVSAGTISAKEFYSLIVDGSVGTIVGTTNVVFKNNHSSKAFIVELDRGGIQLSNVLTFKLCGASTQYPKKTAMITDIKNGQTPLVELLVSGDKLVANYEDDLAGYVDGKANSGLSDYKEILAAVGTKKVAKITKLDGRNFIGEIEVHAGDFVKTQSTNTLSAISQKVIQNELITEEGLQERISYMESCGVTEKQMVRVFESYKVYSSEISNLIPDIKFPKIKYKDDGSGIVRECISYINGDRNLLFEGDRGVGKNVLIETIAWLYKRPLYEFSINAQHDNGSLLGEKSFEVDEDGNNKMKFDLEVTMKAAIEGGILNLDEINTGLAHTLIIFNSLLDDRRRITVPGYGTVVAHKNFIVIGSMNRDYQGTFELNEATADRFVPIVFPQLKSVKEILLAKVPEVGLPYINQCDTVYNYLKKIVTDGEVSDRVLSIRAFVDTCIGVIEGLPLKNALIANVVNRCSDKDDRNSIRTAIEAMID